MDSGTEIVYEFKPYIKVYKNGRVERFFGTDSVPPGIDSHSGVSSKDVEIRSDSGLSARVFIPGTIIPGQKLPLLVYFHGGGFLVGSPFCPTYHNFIAALVNEAKIVVVSVDYRLAPEHTLPAAYEDSWAAIKWAASHSGGLGPEAWLNEHADLGRVFLGGDSAGANIAHNVVAQAGEENLGVGAQVRVLGALLVHPYFAKKGSSDVDKSWRFVCPTTTGLSDPRINPGSDPRLARIECGKVLICLAELDSLRERGLFYYEMLVKSGWDGDVEIFETQGEGHVFHLFKPSCEKARALVKKLAYFINQ